MRARLTHWASSVSLVGLAAAGCAVLTIDVDVYKGALANQEHVQREQLAAMAMGVKPLLAELRYTLEQQACRDRIIAKHRLDLNALRPFDDDHPAIPVECPAYVRIGREANFVADARMLSRDARRVNAVLALYEERSVGSSDDIVRPLVRHVTRLVERMEAGRPVVQKFLQDRVAGLETRMKDTPRETTASKRGMLERPRAPEALTEQLSQQVNELANFARGKPSELPEDVKKAISEATQSAIDAWTEGLMLLSSEAKRAEIAGLGANAINAVAWTVVDLTDVEGLVRAVRESPDDLAESDLNRLLMAFPAPDAEERRLTRREAAGMRGLLAELLTDDGKSAEGARRGVVLAQQLGAARRYAVDTRTADDLWDVIMPATPANLEDFKEIQAFAVDDLETLQGFSRGLGTGLGRGRLPEGLEQLIEDHLRLQQEVRATSGQSRDERTKRGAEDEAATHKLLDALTNFAEKVTVLANMDPLVRGASGADPRSMFEVETDNVSRYIRVLQAVGNSILSQVDALRQREAHRRRQRMTFAFERDGLRAAEAASPPALRAIQDELRARPREFPGRDALLQEIAAGDARVHRVVDALAALVSAESAGLSNKRSEAADWRTALEGLKDGPSRAVVGGLKNLAYTTADVRTALATEARRLEDAARAAGRTEEAARWMAMFQVLNSPALQTLGTGSSGTAEDRYNTITGEVDRHAASVEQVVRNQEPVVADLRRWHASASAHASFSRRPVELPASGTAADVTDALLAALRYEHVLVVATQGGDSDHAKRIAAAIELNYAYRSGMIYIRPASMFLRNSYPATTLQQDPRSGFWSNMLAEHGRRQLPFYDWFQGQGESARVTKTIDKQFWQSVNQIRVAGAGDTNYVIAKDDVGNWYVKQYSNNVDDIMRSARQLALFAMGPTMGANLLAGSSTGQPSRLSTAQSAATTVTGSPAGSAPVTDTRPTTQAGRTVLGNQYDRFASEYEKQTLAMRAKLKGKAEQLVGALKRALVDAKIDEPERTKIESKVLIPFAVSAVSELANDKTVEGVKKTQAVLGAELVAALRAIKTYRDDALTRLADNTDPKGDKITSNGADTARTAIDRVVKDLLVQSLKERQAAAVHYETALGIIGTSAGL